MRTIKVTVALVAALAFSVAAAAGAYAHEFNSSNPGAALLAEKVKTQVFKTEAGTVECTGLKVVSGTAVNKSETQEATIKYEGCTAFGFAEVTISNAEYLFMANETVSIKKPITITTIGCEVTVPAQENLKTIKYANSGNNVVLTPSVSAITYSSKGVFCEKEVTNAKNGTYSGTSEVMIDSGSVSWV